jgi:AcrR family transcriptional regulator
MRRLPGELRRAELLDAAVAALLDKGFARATTRDVAAALGIGRGLIHHYFRSWEALQREAFERLAARELEAADAALAGLAPAAALAQLLDWMVPDAEDRHWRLWNDVWDEAQRDPRLAALLVDLVGRWRQRLARLIRLGVEADGFACPDPDGAALRLLGLADGLGGYLLLPNGPVTRREVLAHVRAAAATEVGCQLPGRVDAAGASL